MKKKSYIGSKILIIVLSLIVSLNGLGLIVAGARTKTKRWTIFGIAYIALEWVFLIIESDVLVILATVLYFASIIHTALILGTYGNLLNEKNGVISKSAEVEPTIHEEKIINEKTEYDEKVKSIRLPIGKATIEYNEDGKAKVIISSKSEYEFISNGRSICEARVNNGTICKYE